MERHLERWDAIALECSHGFRVGKEICEIFAFASDGLACDCSADI